MTTLPRAHGAPVLSARCRVAPEDFRVTEVDGFEPAGQGEHLLLTIEKRSMNTAFAARQIARWAGVPEMGIGYAGMKDRHAVTVQRFSVHLPKRVAPDLADLAAPDLRVLGATWHNRKLPRGALKGNRFTLHLRDVAGDADAIDQRLQAIARDGLPNYFGVQRFGRDGDNVAAALRMFAGQRVHRDQRSILLSAARSELFNAVLAARIEDGTWAHGQDGDVWMLDGSQSVFGPEDLTDDLRQRAARQDIHATGPQWGLGELRSQGAVRALEQGVAAGLAELCAGLEAAGLKQERRALRVRVDGLQWQRPAADELVLEFGLAPGAYATGLLEALGDVADAGRPE
ncbi:tRNA pseudouridine(13) synthase TruD [Arenimonas sp. MALMAid1274]|uniref:tRNA pseudouridine(13) synthase TruD n=1 Tax=Arenimonas sp. MALMAid1274 TaxID=3411630 RepID=UPI003BA369DC